MIPKTRPFKPCRRVEAVVVLEKPKRVRKATPIQSICVSALVQRLHALPDEEREIVKGWMRRRLFASLSCKRDFLRDALATVGRAMNCQKKCCAEMSRAERLADLRELQGGSDTTR